MAADDFTYTPAIAADTASRLSPYQGQSINRRAESADTSFGRKYANMSAADAGVSEGVFSVLKAYEERRAAKGQSTLSPTQTAGALKSAQEQTHATPAPEKNLLNVPGNALSDLTELVKSLPRLPVGLYNEAKRLTDLPGEIAKVDELSDIADLPGVNLLPGAFIAGNVLEGPEGWRELAEHPLYTVLDALPGAKQLAKGTRAAKLAEEVASANIAAGMPEGLNRVNPLKSALTKRVADTPAGPVLENRVLGNLTDMAMDTRPAMALSAAFGRRAREAVKPINQATNEVRDLVLSNKPIPEAFADMAPVIESARQLNGLRVEAPAKYGMTEQRIAEITRDMQLNPSALDALPDNEAAYLAEAMEHRAVIDKWELENNFLAERMGEMLLPEQAAKMDRASVNFQSQWAKTNDRAERTFAKYLMPKGTRVKDFVEQMQMTDGSYALWRQSADQIPAQLRPVYDAWLDWGENSNAETLAAMRKEITNLGRRRTNLASPGKVGPASDASAVSMMSELRGLADDANAMVKRQRNLDRESLPARFAPAVLDKATNEYIAYRWAGDDAAIDAATEAYKQGTLEMVEGFNKKKMRSTDPSVEPIRGLYDFFDDIAPTWKQMRDEGFDPTYVHRVTPQQAAGLGMPKLGIREYKPSQLKDRMIDMTPMVDDVTIAMQHEAVELIKSRAIDELIGNLGTRLSVDGAELRASYLNQAQRMAEIDPTTTVAAHIDSLIKKRYRPYDAVATWGEGKGQKFTATGGPDRYIRNVDASVLDQMLSPGHYKLASAIDPLTGVMRTSLLALSPRWHVNNILSGFIGVQAGSGWGVWKHLPDAMKALKTLKEGGDPGLPRHLVSSLGGLEREAAEYAFRAGGTMRRLSDMARNGREGIGAMTPGGGPGAVKSTFDKVVAKSYSANQFVDDVYRVTAYLDGFDSSLTKGMTREESINVGLRQASKVLQDMTELTPFESAIMKQIFPFYAFYGHIMRYTLSMPIDHPLRVSIAASIARNEMESLGGLPPNFLEAFVFGEPDAEGRQKGINLTGTNPFSGVAGLFTMAGWLGATNPLAKTMIESLGIDTMSGAPELYPQLGYDPTTGGLTVQGANPLERLLANTLPQSQIVGELLGANTQYNDMLKTNPSAAYRMLQSQAGLPILVRDYNPTEKRITLELDRQKAASNEASELIKRGKIDELLADPRYAPQVEKLIEDLQSGALEAGASQNVQPNAAQIVGGAAQQFVGGRPASPVIEEDTRAASVKNRLNPY